MAEVEGFERVGRGVMGLLRLWKSVEKSKAPTRKSDVWATQIRSCILRPGHPPGVLAGAVLRFQRLQQREEEGKVKLHECESGDSRTGETSERLGVE